jgi:peptidoglycan hydrolase-like protein with peptidoglycan-binding domain
MVMKSFDGNKKAALLIISVVLLLVIGLFRLHGSALGQDQILYWGSRGPEVKKVQALLNRWGYYGGAIDGYYSGKTFQPK